jgi:hypothetical protein
MLEEFALAGIGKLTETLSPFSLFAADLTRAPRQIKPLNRALAKRTDALVGHLAVDQHEDLGDERLM